jgi:hypothetical protein
LSKKGLQRNAIYRNKSIIQFPYFPLPLCWECLFIFIFIKILVKQRHSKGFRKEAFQSLPLLPIAVIVGFRGSGFVKIIYLYYNKKLKLI